VKEGAGTIASVSTKRGREKVTIFRLRFGGTTGGCVMKDGEEKGVRGDAFAVELAEAVKNAVPICPGEEGRVVKRRGKVEFIPCGRGKREISPNLNNKGEGNGGATRVGN